jgi:hypothetical protein
MNWNGQNRNDRGLTYCPGNFLEKLRTTTRSFSQVVSLSADIRTRDLENTSHKRCRLIIYKCNCRVSSSRVSSAGIVTGYELGDRGFEVRIRVFFLLSAASRPALGPTQSRIQWILRKFFPEVKWMGREADHKN